MAIAAPFDCSRSFAARAESWLVRTVLTGAELELRTESFAVNGLAS